ncbi:MAG TPA: response regulator [Candidatus Sulfotelmatobacter sp.]|nr:response regulator [Candidatus Sulfotelmatobacter sp.]
MPGRERKRRTILHFSADRIILFLRAWSLNEMGYRVLNARNATEAVELATRKRVDAVVLDLDRNHDEVTMVAAEIKRRRPQTPTILLTEGTAAPERACELADALLPKRDDLDMLATALKNVLDSGVPE